MSPKANWRVMLAKFFTVHPGYLVDDPVGFQTELISDVGALEDKLDLWLISGAERFRQNPEVSQALVHLARHADSRQCLVLLDAILHRLRADEITLCDFSLREGLILDYIARHRKQIAQADRYPDVRRRSVVELAERCHYWPEHASQVARIAVGCTFCSPAPWAALDTR